MTVFLDTNAYTALLRRLPEAVELVDAADSLALSPIVVGELRAGFALGLKQSLNLDQLQRVLDDPRVNVPAIDEPLTTRYASVVAQLRRDGRPIPTNDLWIAAAVIEDDAVLYTYDSHFDSVEGLRTIRSKGDLDRFHHGGESGVR